MTGKKILSTLGASLFLAAGGLLGCDYEQGGVQPDEGATPGQEQTQEPGMGEGTDAGAFENWDQNSDGYVSQEELTSTIQQWDQDGDGRISQEEWGGGQAGQQPGQGTEGGQGM